MLILYGVSMDLNQEQYEHLEKIWRRNYLSTDKTVDSWLKSISHQSAEKDIKKINETLSYLQQNNIPFKDKLLDIYNNFRNPHGILPQFSFCTIFNFLKTHNLIENNEIPIDHILNVVGRYDKKSRFHFENQIKLVLLLPPEERLIDHILVWYTEIHKNYELDLQAQKKILKIFTQYAGSFIKTLDNTKQDNIFQRLDFLCSGLNNKSVKDISIEHEEEYSFRFTLSVNNSIQTCNMHFMDLKNVLEYVIEKMPKDDISNIFFKNLNTQPKLGLLQFQYAFFSHNKQCIEKYSQYFKEFNTILTEDLLKAHSGNSPQYKHGVEYYLELFNKLCFKNKLLDKLESKHTSVKTYKI